MAITSKDIDVKQVAEKYGISQQQAYTSIKGAYEQAKTGSPPSGATIERLGTPFQRAHTYFARGGVGRGTYAYQISQPGVYEVEGQLMSIDPTKAKLPAGARYVGPPGTIPPTPTEPRLISIKEEERVEPIKEIPPSVYSLYKPAEWKKAPIERATYELGRVRERIYQRRRPGIGREMAGFPLGLASAGLGMISAVFHPIKTVKGMKELIISPAAREELGIGIGRALRAEPGYATGYATGIFLGARGFKPVGKGIRVISKKISPKYVAPKKVGIKYGVWTEKVPLKKQLALAERKITLVQVSPKPWFKAFRKEAVVRVAKRGELGPARLRAGEIYSYWAPKKALLGFGDVTPTAEVGLAYALRHPAKVKWTIFGKPTAEIKIVKAKVKPLPKAIMKMKPGLKAERLAAEYIMKKPGEFYIPAEVKRPIALQEYQVALGVPTKVKAISKKWTEISGQKVKIVRAEIKKPFKPIELYKKPKIPIARELALEKIGKPLKARPQYYAPTKYYPVAKVARAGLIPSYKPPTEIHKQYSIFITYPYGKPPSYKPQRYKLPEYIAYKMPSYPKPFYYPARYYGIPPKIFPYKPPIYLIPTFGALPAIPKKIITDIWEKRRKAPEKFRRIPQPQKYVPSLPATILRITARRKPYVIPKRFAAGFFPGIRPIIRKRKKR